MSSSLLALYVAGFVFALYRTLRWMEASQGTLTLEAPVGEWNTIGSSLYRARKLERAVRQDLDRSVEQLRQILERMPDGVVIVDAALTIYWANATAERHLGLDMKQDTGLRLTNLVREPDFISIVTSGPGAEPKLVDLAASGLTLRVQTVAFSSDQNLIFTRDVSESERLDVMRRDFIANVSHELRTPLTVLSGFLELASPQAPLTAGHLDLMRNEALRMQRLIEDLLTLSRLESSHGPASEDVVALDSMAERSLSLAKAISSGSHEFLAHLLPLRIKGSEQELESALNNLLINAVRYTPAGGTISLQISLQDHGAQISVTDTGMGIAAEHIPRLTERFYRVDKSRSRETGGTGLGLAIVKHVMQRHQGQLGVSSTVGQGSTFTLLIPRQRLIIT